MKMGTAKNMLKGILFTIIYFATTMVIPYLTFTWIKNLEVMGVPIVMSQLEYERILFWISAFGLLISGCAFFNYSSPKQSIRKAVFALIQIILNSLYIWSYKFSGATEVHFEILSVGALSIDFQQMIILYMGIYFLTIILKGYDLIDFTVNRHKIREKRYSKGGGGE
jgi:hypothetical protein